jgi:hypothetical protein
LKHGSAFAATTGGTAWALAKRTGRETDDLVQEAVSQLLAYK